MHCRSSYPTNNIPQCSSFLFVHTNNNQYHNQITNTRRHHHHHRRRRLEDPIITYASNYYATYSHQTLHSPPPSPISPPKSSSLLTGRRFNQKSTHKDGYCDLYNLLEHPPSVKPKKKDLLNDGYLHCCHPSMDSQQTDITMKKSNKRNNRSTKINCQRHLLSKGFFRRIANNYFCTLKTDTDGEIST